MLQELLNSLDRTKPVYIHTHDFPDPDALASACGLQFLLESQGISPIICYGGNIDRIATKRMLDNFNITVFDRDQLREEGVDFSHSQNILVDSQPNNSNLSFVSASPVYCIDHHPMFHSFQHSYLDLRMVGACASIITSYFQEAGILPSEAVASALIYGIKMDTDNFNRGTTRFDIDQFAYLFPVADNQLLAELNHNTLSLDDLRAYGAAIDHVKTIGCMGFAEVPFACHPALVAIISDFLLSTQEVSVSVVFSHEENGYKFSVRSDLDWLDCGQLIAGALKGLGNGGGHPSMAGGFLDSEKAKALLPDLYAGVRERFYLQYQALREIANRTDI